MGVMDISFEKEAHLVGPLYGLEDLSEEHDD